METYLRDVDDYLVYMFGPKGYTAARCFGLLRSYTVWWRNISLVVIAMLRQDQSTQDRNLESNNYSLLDRQTNTDR